MVKNNFTEIKKILTIILFANLFTAILKIIIGIKINSISLSSDGFHSLTDGTSNIIGLIGINIASKPKDSTHPYGHKKFETLTGLGIAIMLFFISFNIIKNSIIKLFSQDPINVSFESIVALVFTLFLNIFISSYEYKKGKELNSSILIADSMHTKSDIFVSIGVLLTLIALKIGIHPIFDPIISIIISLFIIITGFKIFKSTSAVLVDTYVIDNSTIKNILSSFPEVKNIHKIRSRGREDNIFIDLHVMVDENLTVKESHNLMHRIENKIKETINPNIEVIIHIEPYDNRPFYYDKL